jgi:hypothetical protein
VSGGVSAEREQSYTRHNAFLITRHFLRSSRQVEREGISVIVHDYCHSACILVAVASAESYADKNAVFGFHRTSPVAEIESEIARYSTDILEKESVEFLRQRGVPDKTLAEAAKHGPDSLHLVMAGEMVEFGAIKGIVSEGQVTSIGSKR